MQTWSTFVAAAAPLLMISAVQVTVLLGAAGLLTLAWRSATAAARHYIWAVAVAGAVILPAATAVTPWRAQLPVQLQRAPTVTVIDNTPASETSASNEFTRIAASDDGAIVPATAFDWRVIAVSAWLLGALLLLVRLQLNEVVMHVYRARSQPVQHDSWLRARDRAAQRVGAPANVALLRAPALQVPLATGYRSPAVLLPAASAEWSDELRELVLLHELAHIARRDLLVQTIAHLARALYWFNPLVWWACARLRAEAERASDDRVLRTGIRASSYAACLLALVRTHRAPRLAAALPMAQRAGFEGRLLAILDARTDRRGAQRTHITVTTAACAAIIALLSALTPARAADVAELTSNAPPPQRAIEQHSAAASAPAVPAAVVPAPPPQAQRAPSASDSARLVRRRPVSSATFAITSRDGAASLLLVGDAILLQLTDRWIDSVAAQTGARGEENDFAKRLLQNLIRAGITTLLDHAVEYPLSGIGSATYEDGELLLLNRAGQRVFNNTRINSGEVMQSFSRRDAQAFATRVNRAIYGGRVSPRSIMLFALRGENADNIVSGKIEVMVEAMADPVDDVRRVEIRVDGVAVCYQAFTRALGMTRITCPFNTAETDAAGQLRFANGPHTLTAVGLDSRGDVVMAGEYNAPLRFDNAARNAATITIDSITPVGAGNVVSGTVMVYGSLSAEVEDDVRRVEMRVDDLPVCVQTFSRPPGSVQGVATIYHVVRGSCPWNTADVDAEGKRRHGDGQHTLTAVALNSRGEVVVRATFPALYIRNAAR